jgi:hypothetical protein
MNMMDIGHDENAFQSVLYMMGKENMMDKEHDGNAFQSVLCVRDGLRVHDE